MLRFLLGPWVHAAKLELAINELEKRSEERAMALYANAIKAKDDRIAKLERVAVDLARDLGRLPKEAGESGTYSTYADRLL